MPIKKHKKKHTVKKYRKLKESTTHNYTNKRISEICRSNSKVQSDLELFDKSKSNSVPADTYQNKKNILIESLNRSSNKKKQELIKSDFYDYIKKTKLHLE